jgi:hypothetical protein
MIYLLHMANAQACNVTIVRLQPGVQVVVAGSYRRGKPESADIDMLIFPPTGVEKTTILPRLVDDLAAVGLFTDHLALPTEDPNAERASYMGVCKLPGESQLHRRIDIKVGKRY